jgi:hypothetical protein
MTFISQLCYNYLKKKGYFPEYVQEHISFKGEHHQFYIEIHKDDDQFLKLLLPKIYPLNSSERSKALAAANTVNQTIKVGKIMIMDDNTVIAFTEQYIGNNAKLEDFFDRNTFEVTRAAAAFAVEMMPNNMIDNFLNRMRG